MNSADICAALRERYKQPEWALFFEVGSGTGANCRRHADALAMNMYPSRGLSIIGFEVKVSRGDLMRELINPDKAEEIAKYCNEWWLAVPKGLIKENDSIPVPWGVIECNSGSLRVAKKAEYHQANPVTKDFMAAVLRSAGKVDEATIRESRDKAYRDCMQRRDELVKQEVESRTRDYKDMKEHVAGLEALLGENFHRYTQIEGIAERLKLAADAQALDNVLKQRYCGVVSVRRQMEEFLKETEKYATPHTN